ncbi:MAG TPA: PASTA domain-containing protein [Gaiellaceae bacterium]|nr:PASTA domain-containing protein [Gaiellaceae bacterium]
MLALLGIAAAAAAGAWYLRLGSGAPARLSVPHVIGLTEQEAVHQLTTEGFAVRAIERPAEASAGVVVAQRPKVNVRLARGELVTISVANGQTTRNLSGR